MLLIILISYIHISVRCQANAGFNQIVFDYAYDILFLLLYDILFLLYIISYINNNV